MVNRVRESAGVKGMTKGRTEMPLPPREVFRCFRDLLELACIEPLETPDALAFGRNAEEGWRILKGKLVTAAKHVFDRRNLTSLKAVWEDRKWVAKV